MKRRHFLRLTAAYFGLNILKEAAPPPPPLFDGDWLKLINEAEGHYPTPVGTACPKGHVRRSRSVGGGANPVRCQCFGECGGGVTYYCGHNDCGGGRFCGH